MKKILVIGMASILLFSGILAGAGATSLDDKQQVSSGLMNLEFPIFLQKISEKFDFFGLFDLMSIIYRTKDIPPNNQPVSQNYCIVNLPTDPVQLNQYHVATDAFFDAWFTGIGDGYDIEDDVHYDGWCIDHDAPLPVSNIYDVYVYSSYCTPPKFLVDSRGNTVDWGKINHLINHKIGSVMDVQSAIRHFVNFGDNENYPGPDNQDNFDTMIDNADSSYMPGPGDRVAVIVDTNPLDTEITEDHPYQYLIVEIPIPMCYEFMGETAWAANGDEPGSQRYTCRGNWATYVEYDEKTVTLFAGRTIPIGTVTFSEIDENEEVSITITLDEPWILEEIEKDGDTLDEAVKIQGYNTAPSGNPRPGRFDTYKGSELEMKVQAFDFYGIHLDVGYWEEVEC